MIRHDTLLVACPSQEHRALLRRNFENRFNLLEASNLNQMLLLLEQNLDCVAALIIDSSMRNPENRMSMMDQEKTAMVASVPVIVIAEGDSKEELGAYFRFGASDVIPLDYDPFAMLRRVDNLVQLHLHKQHLEAVVQEQSDMLRHTSDQVVDALSAIIESRSAESGRHILRMRNFTRILLDQIMEQCPEYHLTPRLTRIIASAATLHDIGKIGIPDSVLMKPGPLTPEEREIMKTHTVVGSNLLENLTQTLDPEYLKYAHNICHYHHERWDGNGYPEGLAGDAIPICAQAVGLADCYDALTSQRVYKDAYPFSRAVNMIFQGECGVFSPKLLECFKNVTGAFADLSRKYADGLAPEAEVFDMTIPEPDIQEVEENTLERTRAKYYTMVHYLGGFLVEVDLDRELFHVVYNPYPEIVHMQDVNTLQELAALVADQIVVPQERQRMLDWIHTDLPRFVDNDLRRASYRFHYLENGQTKEFEMTLLRIANLSKRRSVAILCRKVEEAQASAPLFPEMAWVCRNDRQLSTVQQHRDSLVLAGYTAQEAAALEGADLMDLVHPQDREALRQQIHLQLRDGNHVQTEHRLLRPDGSAFWVTDKMRMEQGPDGTEYVNCYLSDISNTKAEIAELQKTLNRYSIVLSQTENTLFDWDVSTGQIEFHETWEKIFGYEAPKGDFFRILTLGGHIHPDSIPLIADRVSALEKGSNYEMVEVKIATHEGRYRWCRIRASAIRDHAGKLMRVVGVLINIDGEKEAQQELLDAADRDALTGLLNKAAGRRHAEEYLARFPEGIPCALLIVDLDNFKQVNDRFGHLFGDAVLARVAKEIQSLFHSQDLLCRIGGDEFLILVRGTSDRRLLEAHCRRLLDALHEAFRHLDVDMGCSIGIALCPSHGTDYFHLFTHADEALYHTKQLGKNGFSFYEEGTAWGKGLDFDRQNTPIDSDREPGLGKVDISHAIFRMLYNAQDLPAAIRKSLSLMGRHTNVSRVYIFENSPDDRHCSNTFEWCNDGIEPQIGNLQNVSYDTDLPTFRENFDEEGIFYCPNVQDLPPITYEIVEPQGIKSMLLCAMREGGQFRGYIGFDECSQERLWTQEEIDMLAYCAEIISLFLLKRR